MTADSTQTPDNGSWTGFSPGPYGLDPDAFDSLTVTVQCEGTEVSATKTLPQALRLCTPGLARPGDLLDLDVVACNGQYRIEGDHFCRNLLEILQALQAKGADALNATWFYYAKDEKTDEPGVAYSFFIVDADRIVEAQVTLFDHAPFDKSFRPDVLESLEKFNKEHGFWGSHFDEATALSRVWYPRFYAQTTAGQLMVARSDEQLFFFTRPAQTREQSVDNDNDAGVTNPIQPRDTHAELVSRLARIETLLKWIAVSSVVAAILLLVRLFR